jgi:hypothetical protein
LSGGKLGNFRIQPGGFRFTLELAPGNKSEGAGGPNLNGLQPGNYLVEFRQSSFTVQPISNVPLKVEFLRSPDHTISVNDQIVLQVQVSNPGMKDAIACTLVVEARNGDDTTNVLTKPVDLFAGDLILISGDWQPLKAGLWDLHASLSDADGNLLGETKASLDIARNENKSPLAILALTSPGLGLPILGLLAVATLVCGLVFSIALSREHSEP